MEKMTVSARQIGPGRARMHLRRASILLPVASLICIVCLGWSVVGIVHAAENVATPLPPQPAAMPTQMPQNGNVAPPAADESLVWPWKQENPEPKARLGKLGMNSLDRSADAVDANAVSAANNVTSVGQMGGASFRVAVSGSYAYIGSGYKLTILNISNPAALSVAGKTNSNWADEVLGIGVRGSYAYVATGNEGLRVVDVSNPTSPAEVGFYNTPGYAWDVAIDGNFAYVADGEYGLQIVDVTTAYAPQLKANLKLPGVAMDVVVAGTYAYVADETEGLRIVNIADPTYPVETGFVKTHGRAVGLAVAENYVFLAADTAGLRILDVSNKTSPREVAAFDTRGNAYAVDLDATANTAFLADAGEGLRAVDISNKTSPRDAGRFDVAGCWANDIKVNGSYAYLIDTSHGLRVLNVTNPGELSQVYLYNSPAPTGVKVLNNYAYISAGSSGLRVINISDMANPTETGYFDTPGYAYAIDLVIPPGSSSTYAAVADWEKGLRIIDVTTPAAPHEIGAADTPGMARDVAVLWPYAYVADDSQGLQVISLSDLAHPTMIAGCDQQVCMPAGGSARGVIVTGQHGSSKIYAYVADGDKGLRLIDVTNPAMPAPLGFYDTPGQAQNVALSPTQPYAYVADGFSGGLQIVDISSPTALVSLGALDTEGSANALSVWRSADKNGDVVFLADGSQGLRVFGVTTPAGSRPVFTEKGFYDTRGWAGGLTVVNKNPYIADGEDGLRILEVSGSWISRSSPARVPSAALPRSITGMVSDDQGQPLAGVSFMANQAALGVTDANGNYSINGLPPQTVIVTPALSGYQFTPGMLTLTSQESVKNANFVGRRAAPDALSGHVVDADGKPLAGVIIKVAPEPGGAEIDANTVIKSDEKGVYVVQGLKNGRYILTPQKEGFVFTPPSISISFPAQAGQAAIPDFTGRKDARVSINANAAIYPFRGVVRDEGGAPLAGVVVRDEAGHQVTTDENGVYLMALPGGAYTITPDKEGLTFEPPTRQVTVGPALQSQDFSVTSADYSMSGIIRCQGKPLAAVSLSDGSGQAVTSDENGVFHWSAKAGDYVLTPVKEGFAFVPNVLRVTFPAVNDAMVEIAAQGGASVLGGIVLAEDSSPLAGVSIADNSGQSTSDRTGQFTLERAPGTYTFQATKDGYTISPASFQATFPGLPDGKKIELLATPLCPNYLLNGDFERDGDWSTQSGVQAEYSAEAVFRGGRSAMLGPVQGSKPLNGHITLRQKVSIPKNAKSADLRFMLYLFSEYQLDASGDAQQVLILDKGEKTKEKALNLHGDDRAWKPYRIDLRKYAGQTIWISFDVSNDGKGGNLGMNVDDVTLQVCE